MIKHIKLTDKLTGYSKTIEYDFGETPEDHETIEYLWTDGNMGCDCNASLVLYDYDDSKAYECGYDKMDIEILD